MGILEQKAKSIKQKAKSIKLKAKVKGKGPRGPFCFFGLTEASAFYFLPFTFCFLLCAFRFSLYRVESLEGDSEWPAFTIWAFFLPINFSTSSMGASRSFFTDLKC